MKTPVVAFPRIHYSSLLLLLPLVILSATSHSLNPPPLSLSPVDLSALRAIRATLADVPGGATNFFSTWDFTAPDPCTSFAGITCSPDHPSSSSSSSTLRVSTLTLGTGRSDSPGLLGSLSESISLLTELSQLVLFPGRVSGTLPSQLGFLPNLRVLSITSNALTGRIPDSFSLLANLHTLDLSRNRLTGFIPHTLMALPRLKVLILSSNRLSGDLPAFSNSGLLHLDLRNNRIGGTLIRPPPAAPALSLRYLSLSNNVMWGPLDSGLLESLSELVFLDLSMNRFTGPIPPSVFNSPSLFLQRNSFSGALLTPPDSSSSGPIGGPGSVADLSHNRLSGSLPEALAGVETLYLNNNRFTGNVAQSYVESVYGGRMKTLYLQHNYISEFPVELGMALPDSASLCVSYNCMVPPPALTVSCPASAGSQIRRPVAQCTLFNSRTTGHR
uniref:Leucine-rich repeat-containing N-terminal plant-type domain-containing protein n=1 Tax=Kalanchoe fedtschenkoi TaxID=63787 RepID=A0A7N0T2S8_KALFE